LEFAVSSIGEGIVTKSTLVVEARKLDRKLDCPLYKWACEVTDGYLYVSEEEQRAGCAVEVVKSHQRKLGYPQVENKYQDSPKLSLLHKNV
jgi:hypothetical protein